MKELKFLIKTAQDAKLSEQFLFYRITKNLLIVPIYLIEQTPSELKNNDYFNALSHTIFENQIEYKNGNYYIFPCNVTQAKKWASVGRLQKDWRIKVFEKDYYAILTQETFIQNNESVDFDGKIVTQVGDKILRNFQFEAAERVLSSKKKGHILAFDYGLGKTLTSIAIVKSLFMVGCIDKVIVSCPASLKEEWISELTVAEIRFEVYSDHFSSLKKQLHQSNNKTYFIFDEAHRFSRDSLRTLYFTALSKSCYGVLLLTGNPIRHGKPETCYYLLDAINAVALDRETFIKYYSDNFLQFFVDYQDFILVQDKSIAQLPPKHRYKCLVSLSDEELEFYKKLCRHYVSTNNPNHFHIIQNASALLKAQRMVKMVNEQIKNDKVVIFCAYKSSVSQLQNYYNDRCVVISGEFDSYERQENKRKFQEDESIRVIICSFSAAGFGLTLTAGNHLHLLDRPFSREIGDVINSEDRIWRIGQQKECHIYWWQLKTDNKNYDVINDAKILKQFRANNVMLSGFEKSVQFAT